MDSDRTFRAGVRLALWCNRNKHRLHRKPLAWVFRNIGLRHGERMRDRVEQGYNAEIIRQRDETIAARMRETGQTREQVLDELHMMRDAARRYETGTLTEEDRLEMTRCIRDYYDYGAPGIFRR